LDEEAEAELIRVVEKRPPDVVVVFSRSVKEYGIAEFGKGYDRLIAEWIASNYVAVETLPAGRILRRVSAVTSGTIIAPR